MSFADDFGSPAPAGMAFQPIPVNLTKRELFAAMAMQGILANPQYEPPRRKKLAGMATDAVAAADALLVELEKSDGAA